MGVGTNFDYATVKYSAPEVYQIECQVKIYRLIQIIKEMNLKQGINNSLDAKIQAAVGAIDDLNWPNNVEACNAMCAFMQAVDNQLAAGKLTVAQATELKAKACDIRDCLNCEPKPDDCPCPQ